MEELRKKIIRILQDGLERGSHYEISSSYVADQILTLIREAGLKSPKEVMDICEDCDMGCCDGCEYY